MAKIKKGKSLCIFSAKGGVGKTITTLNLAGVIAAMDKKVLIIDLDLIGGGIAVALNRASEKNIFTLYEDLKQNRYDELNSYVTVYNERIHFIASPKDPRQATKIDARYIESIIDNASFLYDVILIDTNHFLSDLNLLTLDTVDSILFVATNDPLDIKNLKSLLSIFKDLEINKFKIMLNNSRDPFKQFFNAVDIANILKANIDYVISENMFVKNIDTYVMNGQILTTISNMPTAFAKDYATLTTVITDVLESGVKQ